MEDLGPVLRHFPNLTRTNGDTLPAATNLPTRRLTGGLINATWALGDHHVLQRLHPIFDATVHLDIAALTAILTDAGVPVPRLVESAAGRPWVELPADGATPEALHGVWRLMTRLPGRTIERVSVPAEAHCAGALVARFHGALRGVAHEFAFTRPGAHDTDAHLARLANSVEAHAGHRLVADVAPIATELAARWADTERPTGLPARIGHGDLKIANLRFAPDGPEATGVLDLDTMAWLDLSVELGDALRSWCNPASEDSPGPTLDVDIFGAAVAGWLTEARDWATAAEVGALVPGLERICLELAARFAWDALEERYFGWNPAIAPTRGDHNLVRARGQLALARQVAAARGRLQALVAQAWSSARPSVRPSA